MHKHRQRTQAYARRITTRARRAVEKISSQTVGNSNRSDSQDFLNKKKRGEERREENTTQAHPIELHLLNCVYVLAVSMCPDCFFAKTKLVLMPPNDNVELARVMEFEFDETMISSNFESMGIRLLAGSVKLLVHVLRRKINQLPCFLMLNAIYCY
jgi:hypothetical protein